MSSRIIVLGASFGGLTAALEVKRRLGSRASVTVIGGENNFVFLPSLPWLVTGHRRPQDISLPVAAIFGRRGVDFRHEAALEVDPLSQQVTTTAGRYPYDYLVIATGPELAYGEIPGLGPLHGHSHCIFNLTNAIASAAAWEALLSEPGPLILGATQFASCFGPYYELAFEMDYELRRRRLRHKVPIVYLSSEPWPGHMGIDGLGRSRRFIEDEFAVRDIKHLCNRTVAEVAPEAVHLTDGTVIPFKLALLAPPFRGVPAVAGLGNPRGFIPVDSHLRHPAHPNIYTVGVAMALAPREPTAVPTGVPKTGSMTVLMAKTAAANICLDILHRPLLAADELPVFCMLDMGNTAAFMYARPILPPRQTSVLKKSRWARHAKLVFERYFLWKMRHGLSWLP